MYFADASGTRSAIRRRAKAINFAAFSQHAHEAKVPAAVFIHTSPTARSKRTDLIDAVVEMKRRNRSWGYKRIAQQIALAFGVDIDKDVVRRILGSHFRPQAGSGGPSWLSFIGHAQDSLWSLDLFRCESAVLRTHWVLLVMDQFTRRIVGFAVHRGVVDGMALCRMFNCVVHTQTLPRYLSADHDPPYRFHQWQANPRVLEIQEIKTVPYVPLSHPIHS